MDTEKEISDSGDYASGAENDARRESDAVVPPADWRDRTIEGDEAVRFMEIVRAPSRGLTPGMIKARQDYERIMGKPLGSK